jgi:hypothetical protein
MVLDSRRAPPPVAGGAGTQKMLSSNLHAGRELRLEQTTRRPARSWTCLDEEAVFVTTTTLRGRTDTD